MNILDSAFTFYGGVCGEEDGGGGWSTLNPIALVKAKIVYNFGLPGAIKVKIYTISAFLSAIGLTCCTQKGQNCIQFLPF